MSCSSCIYRVALRPIRPFIRTRSIATTSSLRYSTPTAPLNTPETPAAEKTTTAPHANLPVSAAPAGTVLKGLNYFKNKQDPIALEDHEYPEWLWTVLDQKKGGGLDGEDEGDLYSKSKKARRIAARRAAKLASQGFSEEKPIPLHEQTIDLPFATTGLPKPHTVAAIGIEGSRDGTAIVGGEEGLSEITVEQAFNARATIRKLKREQNRAALKENNFLGGL